MLSVSVMITETGKGIKRLLVKQGTTKWLTAVTVLPGYRVRNCFTFPDFLF